MTHANVLPRCSHAAFVHFYSTRRFLTNEAACVPSRSLLGLSSRAMQCRLLSCTSARLQSFDSSDEAYIFQPSPYRELRRQIYGSSSEAPGSVNASNSSTSSSSSSAAVEETSEKTVMEYESHEAFIDALNKLTGDPLEEDGGRIVTFRGSPSARVMVIGEAPGEQEDAMGVPFVGNAGQLLDKIFLYGGFDLNRQLYITNVVKRRPRDNRTPTRSEVSFYLPFLLEEVRLINPALIVLAGSVALRAFFDSRTTISSVRGTWFGGEEGKPWIMPVYHPSYLLRKQAMKHEMVTDIKAIREKYLELFPNDPLNPLTPKQ